MISETLLLVHSPIVGSDTWGPVAHELRAGDVPVVVPTLADDGTQPFWRQHVTSAADDVDSQIPAGTALIVVVHSGAGQLTALLGHELLQRGRRPAGYLFVDAGLPPDDRSRLDQLRDEAPQFAEQLEEILAARRQFPDWDDQQLRPLVPDRERRRRLIAGLRRLPSGFWTEPIPGVPGWDQVPIGVVLFSSGYEATATAAEEHGWPVRNLDVENHFHMLDQPNSVADVLEELARQVAQEDPPNPSGWDS